MTSALGVITCVLAVCLPMTTGYGTGPPVVSEYGLCSTMQPQHGVDAKTSGRPYEIVTSGTCFNPGMKIKVLVRLNATAVDPYQMPYFEGMFLMARSWSGVNLDTSTNYGTFQIPRPNNITTLKCFDRDNSAVGHTKSTHWKCREFTWIAPDNFYMNITMQATVVRNKENYWMDVRSPLLWYSDFCPEQAQLKCDGGDVRTSGSNVIRAMVTTCLWLVLAALVM